MIYRILTLSIMVLGINAKAGFSKELANINGRSITDKNLKDALERLGNRSVMIKSNPSLMEDFLQQMINSDLLASEAQKVKLQDSAEFKDKMEAVRKDILAKMFIENYINTKATESAIKEYFTQNEKLFSKKEVKASHILLADEAKAKEVLVLAMKKDTNFEELNKKYTTAGNGPKGGDLGYFGRGRMLPEFEKAAFATKKGEVHPKLVKTQFGYHIIKVEDIRGEGAVKFEEVKQEVENQFKQELHDKLIADLRKNNKISVKNQVLKEIKF